MKNISDTPPTGAEGSGYPEVSMGQSGLVQKTKSTYPVWNMKVYQIKDTR
jgi:hypothetical protein